MVVFCQVVKGGDAGRVKPELKDDGRSIADFAGSSADTTAGA